MCKFWLVKQEPTKFSWQDFWSRQAAVWDGVRNYQARNNLRAMELGDYVLFYHSVTDKRVMGIARVSKTAFPDPTAEDSRWLAVELVPVLPLQEPVTLAAIKAHPALQNIPLIRQSRLSVMPLKAEEFEIICTLGKTPLHSFFEEFQNAKP
ncbi:MAG: EVE domain-containing protein [Bacteroidia bacterium]|nr:EVE domain-containing protein [Bacteroidia bacterium]MDW8159189.1 EVE domain-containing protein [Bacteroidia bacterium]